MICNLANTHRATGSDDDDADDDDDDDDDTEEGGASSSMTSSSTCHCKPCMTDVYLHIRCAHGSSTCPALSSGNSTEPPCLCSASRVHSAFMLLRPLEHTDVAAAHIRERAIVNSCMTGIYLCIRAGSALYIAFLHVFVDGCTFNAPRTCASQQPGAGGSGARYTAQRARAACDVLRHRASAAELGQSWWDERQISVMHALQRQIHLARALITQVVG